MATVVVTHYTLAERTKPDKILFTWKAAGDTANVGRDARQCAITLDKAAAGVSRVHAVISFNGQTLTLRDQSAYGTFVNGVKVHNTTHTLKDGDALSVGDTGRFILKTVTERRPQPTAGVPRSDARTKEELPETQVSRKARIIAAETPDHKLMNRAPSVKERLFKTETVVDDSIRPEILVKETPNVTVEGKTQGDTKKPLGRGGAVGRTPARVATPVAKSAAVGGQSTSTSQATRKRTTMDDFVLPLKRPPVTERENSQSNESIPRATGSRTQMEIKTLDPIFKGGVISASQAPTHSTSFIDLEGALKALSPQKKKKKRPSVFSRMRESTPEEPFSPIASSGSDKSQSVPKGTQVAMEIKKTPIAPKVIPSLEASTKPDFWDEEQPETSKKGKAKANEGRINSKTQPAPSRKSKADGGEDIWETLKPDGDEPPPKKRKTATQSAAQAKCQRDIELDKRLEEFDKKYAHMPLEKVFALFSTSSQLDEETSQRLDQLEDLERNPFKFETNVPKLTQVDKAKLVETADVRRKDINTTMPSCSRQTSMLGGNSSANQTFVGVKKFKKAAQGVFNEKALATTSRAPVEMRPYTVYVRDGRAVLEPDD